MRHKAHEAKVPRAENASEMRWGNKVLVLVFVACAAVHHVDRRAGVAVGLRGVAHSHFVVVHRQEALVIVRVAGDHKVHAVAHVEALETYRCDARDARAHQLREEQAVELVFRRAVKCPVRKHYDPGTRRTRSRSGRSLIK